MENAARKLDNFESESEFTNFFSKLIRCQDNLEGKPFIQLILRHLIKIAEGIAFINRENLINIAGEYEENVIALEDFNANNLPSFLSLMNEPQMKIHITIPPFIIGEIP